jgi:glycosyltransferase involved in cell wall biosynthesis
MRKKILICCNAYPPHFIGGAELVAHAQAKQLQNLGYDVLVFTGDPSEHGQRHSVWREDYEGLPVYRVRLTYEDYDYKFVNFTHKDIEEYFKKLLNRFSPEIVHFHNIIGLSVGLIHIAKQRGVKTVLTLHDHWGFCFKNTLIKNDNEICQDFSRCSECMPVISGENNLNLPMQMRQDFFAMQLEEVDAFISPSRYLADTYIRAGIPPKKMYVIWNGIDVQKFASIKKIPDPSGCIRFTFIGYFGKHKGIQVLLDALQYMDIKQKLVLNLIGSGDLIEQYKKEVAGKGLNDRVKFWGRIENIEGAYAKTDVFILPSIWPENQPVSITEAMSAGIPVIASNGGGIPELIEHDKTGLLFETGNARDLAEKMSQFIEKPENIRLLGKHAFEKIKTDTLEDQVKKIMEVYNQIQETGDGNTDGNTLIVCHGKHIDPMCTGALKKFSKDFNLRKILFVLSDWLNEDQLRTGALFWIIDECQDPSAAYFGLNYKLPLLVPEKNQELKKMCVQFNCGLFYRDSLEAGYAIQYLLDNKKERITMIKNGIRARGSFPNS